MKILQINNKISDKESLPQIKKLTEREEVIYNFSLKNLCEIDQKIKENLFEFYKSEKL